MGENEFSIIRKVTKIEFWFKNEFYSYESIFEENGNKEYIYKEDELIFKTGNNNPNEGELIYALLKTNLK